MVSLYAKIGCVIKDNKDVFIDSEFIELVRLMKYADSAERFHTQAIEIFESAAQGGSTQAVGELVKLYGDKNFVYDFNEDDSFKKFFENAQKLFGEILKERETANNFFRQQTD